MFRHAWRRACHGEYRLLLRSVSSHSCSTSQNCPREASCFAFLNCFESKRSFSKSLGTDGGLHPAQVLVPQSYVVFKKEEEEATREAKQKKVFVVVSVGSLQYKVTTDDVFYVEKLRDATVDDIVVLPRVLLLGSERRTVIGRPVVEGAKVTCAVEEVVRDGKTVTFKKRRRKNSRRWNGARQTLTGLRVLNIEGLDEE